MAIQQGTVAGTIQVQLVDLKQGSNEVLPTPAPLSTLIIPQQAPVITSVCFANQSATGFDVLISGYSNPRSMTNVILTFQAASGAKAERKFFRNREHRQRVHAVLRYGTVATGREHVYRIRCA